MISLIEDHREAIGRFCREYNVSKLEVFGSAVDGSYEDARSDVDFLVEFLPGQKLGPWLAHYLDFKKVLEQLLGCRVDLVIPTEMRNPYFIREVNRTRRVLYAA